MSITVDWSLLGNLRAREGGAVKFFQIRQALASALGTGTLFYIFCLKFYSRIPQPCTFNAPKIPYYSQKFFN